MVLHGKCAVPVFLQTYFFKFGPKSSTLVSSDHRILFITCVESSRYHFTKARHAFLCRVLSNSFFQVTLPWRPFLCRVLLFVLLYTFIPELLASSLISARVAVGCVEVLQTSFFYNFCSNFCGRPDLGLCSMAQ